MKKQAILTLITGLVLALFLSGCVTVVQKGHEGDLTGEKDFDATADVGAIWDSKAVPDLEGNAVELTKLLSEAQGDLKSVAATYGHYSMGDKGELSYIVKGEGTVTAIDTAKKAGTMTLSVPGYAGPLAVKIQIGSVYKGSAVRDCLSFIKYEDYTNQIDWAKVSQAIHETIDKNVVQPLNPPSLQGKTIEFTGCFTVSGDKEILITPVKASVKS